MTRIPDRDETVERLLRQGVGVDAAGSSCPDASELAAWADAELDPTSAAKLDAHIATCAQCQSIVAAFVHSSGAPAAVLPFWRRPAVVLPVLSVGAAAAAVLAIAVWSRPGRTRVPAAPVTTVAESTPAPADVPPAQVLSAPPPSASVPSGDAKTSAPAPSRRQAAAAATPPAASGAPVAAAPAAKAQADVSARAQEATAKPAPAAPMPPPPPPILPPPAPNYMNFDSVTKPLATPTARATTTNAASGTVVAESPLVDTSKIIAVLSAPPAQVPDPYAAFLAAGVARAPSALGVASMGLARGGGGGSRGRAGGVPVAAAPSVATVRWRIATRKLEHSSDAGATWSAVTIDPMVSLTSGAAPSADVCWLIGRGGVVLVTGDAEHFTRVDVPDPVDLVSIQVEPTKVTVAAADGTTFVTADGGRTWTRSALQGFAPPPF